MVLKNNCRISWPDKAGVGPRAHEKKVNSLHKTKVDQAGPSGAKKAESGGGLRRRVEPRGYVNR